MKINRLPINVNKNLFVNHIRWRNAVGTPASNFAAFKKPVVDGGYFLVTAVRIVLDNAGAGAIPDLLRFVVFLGLVTENATNIEPLNRRWHVLRTGVSAAVDADDLTNDEIGCGSSSVGFGLQDGEIASAWQAAAVAGGKNRYDVEFDLTGREVIVTDNTNALIAGVQCAPGETFVADASNNFSVYYYGYYL